jgi:peptidyl-prolyl cis-trans isomerase B (cyclophilin B)
MGTRAALSLPAVPRLLVVLTACFALLLAGCGSSSDDKAASPSDTSTPEATESAAPAANASLPQGCENVSKPGPKDVGTLKKPTEKLSKSKHYLATVSTSCGDFDITLDAKQAPITGGSFKYLADKKFFDGLAFHRIVPDFVIQGGDPKGDGSGGPGYSVVEAPPSSLKYTPGVVAMAKTQAEAPGTSGSQFFVVTGEGAGSLTPDYALLGKVTRGMDVITKIGGIQADPSTGAPAAEVVIKSITVTES